MSSTPTPFSAALSLLLPSQQQTLLLKAVLLPGVRGRSALLTWQAGERDPAVALARHPGGGRLLAPLLYKAVEPDFAGLEAPLLTYLKTAAIREELRAREFRRILIAVLKRMEEAALSALLLRGAALAETVYPDPRFRHSAEIGFLARAEDVEPLGAALRPIGFESAGTALQGVRRLDRHVHRSGLFVTLCEELYPMRLYNHPLEAVWRRSAPAAVLDCAAGPDVPAASALVLSAPDLLLDVCVSAATSSRRENLLWACDVCFLLGRRRDMDWDVFLERVAETRVALPVYLLLRYLAGELEAPIPDAAMSRLAERARAADRLSAELALFGAAAGPGPKLAPMLRGTRSWRERGIIARWRFLPSLETLVSAGLIEDRGDAFRFHAARARRLLARGLRSNGRRLTPIADRPPSG